MKKQDFHRIIFCSFWLYFNAFRGILGHIRFLDYLSIFLVPIGLIMLASAGKMTSKMIQWVTILICPLVVASIVDPSIDIFLFVLRSYMVALYLTIYFKTMRLTIVELACFVFPVVISAYYFLNPRYSDYVVLLQGRMSGIDEPNFTSLSLIISMCGAFGIHMLTKRKWLKVAVIAIAFICFLGVVLTVSRAGFIGATIALCLFLIIVKRKWYASVIATVAIVIIVLSSGSVLHHMSVVPERFQMITGKQNLLTAIIYERPFMERAWHTVQHGEWFSGGGHQRVIEWGAYNLGVPHNSLLDVGIEFGKASFYFYGVLFVVLLFVNVFVIVINRRFENHDMHMLLTPMFFLSLLPMYMFLSAGMTMSFILWMILGAYPLLHLSSKFMKNMWKKVTYRHVKT
jgi:hypothetical protein